MKESYTSLAQKVDQRSSRQLPWITEQNPKNRQKGHMDAESISLRSGKTIQRTPKSVEEPEMVSDDISNETTEEEEEAPVAVATPSPNARKPANTIFLLTPDQIKEHARIPYPLSVKKKGLSK